MSSVFTFFLEATIPIVLIGNLSYRSAEKLCMKKLMLGLAQITLLYLLIACAKQPLRSVASEQGLVPPTLSENLLQDARLVLKQVSSSDYNAKTCSHYLTELSREIEHYPLLSFAAENLLRDAKDMSETLWQIRLTLHRRLDEVGSDCAIELKNTFRLVRFVEDYFMEQATQVQHMVPSQLDFQKEPVPIQEDQAGYLLMKAQEKIQFTPGDVMVTRGLSFLSAMIARLGHIDSQFSHIVFVGRDPADHRIKTIESYVGEGVGFYELPFALKNENARILLLRPKDAKLASEAAKITSQEVRSRIDAGKKIKYDYKLDFTDHKTMSCAEVGQVAYKLGSNDQVNVPMYPSELREGAPLLKSLGATAGPTFSPADLEVDPRFEIIAEFRDLRLTRDSRQKDAVLTQLLSWMDHQDYELVKTFNSRMTGPIWLIRKTFLWPLVQKALKLDNFSKEVPARMLRTVNMINTIGELLLEEIKLADAEHEKKHGWPMTYQDLYDFLEDYRLHDLELYRHKKTRKQAKLHQLLRPKKP